MAGGSKGAVMVALGANSVVAVAKLGGFFFTGSGALLAEFVHSVADVGNQALLAVGLARAAKPADDSHPDGYTREAFVWSLISAVGLFFLGCGVSIYHALSSLFGEAHHPEAGGIAIGILVFSLVVEGASAVVAVRVVQQHARDRELGFFAHLRTTSDPFELAILLEDTAAVLGVLLALVAVGLTTYTHLPIWDSLGTLTIGLLLGAVAIVLIQLNRHLLIGQGVTPAIRARIDEVLGDDPAITKVFERSGIVYGTQDVALRAHVRLDGRYLTERVLEGEDLDAVAASVDGAEALRSYLHGFGDRLTQQVGTEIDRVEGRLRDAIPGHARIAIEPDVASAPAPTETP